MCPDGGTRSLFRPWKKNSSNLLLILHNAPLVPFVLASPLPVLIATDNVNGPFLQPVDLELLGVARGHTENAYKAYSS